MLAAVLLAGCQPKPKAPALLDEPVFQSDEGFRFLVPEGWIMAARGNVPRKARWASRKLKLTLRSRPIHDQSLRAALSVFRGYSTIPAANSGPVRSIRDID